MKIEKNDIVEYIDARNTAFKDSSGKVRYKTTYPRIHGIWDGEKVECKDDEKTTVFKKEWLRKLTAKEVAELIYNKTF